MPINADTKKCTGCGLCELAWSFRRDRVFTTMRSSILLHLDDKRYYLDMMIKLPNDDLVLARPEGLEVQRAGQSSGDDAGASKLPE